MNKTIRIREILSIHSMNTLFSFLGLNAWDFIDKFELLDVNRHGVEPSDKIDGNRPLEYNPYYGILSIFV